MAIGIDLYKFLWGLSVDRLRSIVSIGQNNVQTWLKDQTCFPITAFRLIILMYIVHVLIIVCVLWYGKE